MRVEDVDERPPVDLVARRSCCTVLMVLEVLRKKRMRGPAGSKGECEMSTPRTARARACSWTATADSAVTDIPEDVALAILLHAVASRIDPTGELYMKLCSSFHLSMSTTQKANASTFTPQAHVSPVTSPQTTASPSSLSRMDSLDLGANAAAADGEMDEAGGGRRSPLTSETPESLPSRSGTWGVGIDAPDPLQELRDAQLLGANEYLPSISDLLSHLKSLGLSHLVRNIKERVLASVPTALTRPRFRPLKWKLGRVIGKGAFGECRMAMCEDTGALFAVKIVPMAGPASSVEATLRSVQRELEVLRGVSHPHIVDMFAVSCAAATSTPAALCDDAGVGNTGGGARHDRNTAHAQGSQEGSGLVLNIAMEYMEGGSLAKLIDDFGQLPEQVVASYARQIVLGLEYLHALGVVHADIKPANCLLDKSGLLKLSDFGCAQRIVAHSSTHAHEASQHGSAGSQQGSSRKRGEGELGLQVVSSRAELDKLDDDELSDGGAAVLGALENRLVCHQRGTAVDETRATLRSLMPEGTPNYMPSEVIRYREYSDKSDVWALGLTVLECITGERG